MPFQANPEERLKNIQNYLAGARAQTAGTMSGFDSVPSGSSHKLEHFKAHVGDQELDDFKQLLKLSKIGPKTYENLKTDGYFGISRDWLAESKKYWETKHDWRATEGRINALPQYTTQIEDINVHFMALFSKKADAVPLLLLHGWPGSFLEFLTTCEMLTKKYKPEDLPFHVIVPSLPGYGYSGGPPLDKDYTNEDLARICDKLMTGLGFNAYVSQGGDIGSFLTRILAVKYEACKAAHINLCIGVDYSKEIPPDTLTAQEQKGLARAGDFALLGNAYAREHGTRPATIGLVLSSSPIALLAWVGEKFLQWSDVDPPIHEILDSATLYWFTDSFPRAIFPYRQFFGPKPTFFHNNPEYYIKKPTGYSYHPQELAPVPRAWVAKTCNLVWYNEHDKGGHFAAMEEPELFIGDIENFVAEVWPKAKSG